MIIHDGFYIEPLGKGRGILLVTVLRRVVGRRAEEEAEEELEELRQGDEAHPEEDGERAPEDAHGVPQVPVDRPLLRLEDRHRLVVQVELRESGE